MLGRCKGWQSEAEAKAEKIGAVLRFINSVNIAQNLGNGLRRNGRIRSILEYFMAKKMPNHHREALLRTLNKLVPTRDDFHRDYVSRLNDGEVADMLGGRKPVVGYFNLEPPSTFQEFIDMQNSRKPVGFVTWVYLTH